jgi:predicted hydrocarbon binding protein
MLTSVRVPPGLAPAFEFAQAMVRRLFADTVHAPDQGTIHIGGERYVLVRADSFYLGWFTAMTAVFGRTAAMGFIYNTAREIGRSDCAAFSDKLGLSDGVARLASGPVHFAYAGWAFVEIFEDSSPASDDSYFLHYAHPNTFETEVLRARETASEECACMFSAGYSAGWCTAAFGVEVHAREIRCLARGDDLCEFIMAPEKRLDEHVARLMGSST